VRHTCKLLSPWPIKGRAIPQPRGRRRGRIENARMLSAFTTILALASNNTSWTWRPGLLSLEVAPVRAQDMPRRPNRRKIRKDGRQLRGTA
jgi:hypothetical protein